MIPCTGTLPVEINSTNVDDLSGLLLDQFRKKSQLYGSYNNHDVIIFPLGDDFRYTSLKEAHDQYENYEKLIDYMNNKAEYNVNVRFGTLKDYFDIAKKNNPQVNNLRGDFFTYASAGDQYWSGYYTSRPFYKRLDRQVEYYLRSAEILFSYMNILRTMQQTKGYSSNILSADSMNELYKQLIKARQNLGLFQHHDGITGTAKTPVVLDYQEK